MVAWAKMITNEWREQFDLGRVRFKDVSFALKFSDATYESS